MVYINNSELASEFLLLLSGDGQTMDNDIQRRADTVTTSMQIQKSIGNIIGRPFHSLGTTLLAARQIQKASNSAKHVWTPSTAQDQSFSVLQQLQRMTQHTVPAPSSSYAAPTPMTEYVAPAPDVTYTTPAHTDLVTPAPATKYIAPAHLAPSLDLVNPQFSTARVEASAPKVILQEIPEVQVIERTQEQFEE